jgi:HK97 family phage portal protein
MFPFQASFGAEGETRTRPADDDDFWYEKSSRTPYGVIVTLDRAQKVAAVMACINVLTKSIACLPFRVMEEDDAYPDFQIQARKHPLWKILMKRPNVFQSPFEWKETMIGHLMSRGNAYSRRIGGHKGYVEQLIPLNPDRMKIHQFVNDYTLLYEYEDQDGNKVMYAQDEILHWKLYADNGVMGLSPLEYAAICIDLASTADSHAVNFLRNGGVPIGVIKHPGHMGEQSIENFRRDWNRMHSGSRNSGKTAILEEGMDYKEIGVKPSDAQFLETRTFQLREICRVFGVPPHKIADLEYATYSNVEEQELQYATDTVAPLANRCEEATNAQLIYNDKYSTKFNLKKMLRANISTRYKAYATGRQWGWYSVNEIRAEEEMPRINTPEADEYLKPLNMVDLTAKDEFKPDESESTKAIRRTILGTKRKQVAPDSSSNRIARRNGVHTNGVNGES